MSTITKISELSADQYMIIPSRIRSIVPELERPRSTLTTNQLKRAEARRDARMAARIQNRIDAKVAARTRLRRLARQEKDLNNLKL